jgi:hypothetical protein
MNFHDTKFFHLKQQINTKPFLLALMFCMYLDFSLSTWLSEHGINANESLKLHIRNDLLADLGLDAYLNENECSLKQAGNSDGWINGK